VRADFFWGTGEDAGASAGRMRQQGRMWLTMFKDKTLDKETKARMAKRFKSLTTAPLEVASTTGE